MHCYWLDDENKAMRQALLVWIIEIENHLQLSMMLQKHSANMLTPQTANSQQAVKWAERSPPQLGWGPKLDNAIKQNGLSGTNPVLFFIVKSKTEAMLGNNPAAALFWYKSKQSLNRVNLSKAGFRKKW